MLSKCLLWSLILKLTQFIKMLFLYFNLSHKTLFSLWQNRLVCLYNHLPSPWEKGLVVYSGFTRVREDSNKNFCSKIQLSRNRWYYEAWLIVVLRCVGIWQTSAASIDNHNPEWMMGGPTPWNKHSEPLGNQTRSKLGEQGSSTLQWQCDISHCWRSHFSWLYSSPFAQTRQRWACYPNKLCALGEMTKWTHHDCHSF